MWDVRCEILRQNFLRLFLKTFFLLVHIFLENDISTARTWIVIDFTPTFYLEICQIPKKNSRRNSFRPIPILFLKPILSLFLDQNFRDQYRDFYLRLKLIENDTETFFETKYFRYRYWDFFRDQMFSRPLLRLFLRPDFSRLILILSKKWEKSQYWEVSRRDVTLWLQQDI